MHVQPAPLENKTVLTVELVYIPWVRVPLGETGSTNGWVFEIRSPIFCQIFNWEPTDGRACLRNWACSFSTTVKIETVLIHLELLYRCWVRVRVVETGSSNTDVVRISSDVLMSPWHAAPHVHCYECALAAPLKCQQGLMSGCSPSDRPLAGPAHVLWGRRRPWS